MYLGICGVNTINSTVVNNVCFPCGETPPSPWSQAPGRIVKKICPSPATTRKCIGPQVLQCWASSLSCNYVGTADVSCENTRVYSSRYTAGSLQDTMQRVPASQPASQPATLSEKHGFSDDGQRDVGSCNQSGCFISCLYIHFKDRYTNTSETLEDRTNGRMDEANRHGPRWTRWGVMIGSRSWYFSKELWADTTRKDTVRRLCQIPPECSSHIRMCLPPTLEKRVSWNGHFSRHQGRAFNHMLQSSDQRVFWGNMKM
jgi:hypothetical protein